MSKRRQVAWGKTYASGQLRTRTAEDKGKRGPPKTFNRHSLKHLIGSEPQAPTPHDPFFNELVARLPDTEKQVIELLFAEARTEEQVSEALGIEVAMVHEIKLRALTIMRRDPKVQQHWEGNY